VNGEPIHALSCQLTHILPFFPWQSRPIVISLPQL